MAQLEHTVGFLGFGNMGRAIAHGLIETGTVAPGDLLAYDVDNGKCRDAEAIGAQVVPSPADLAGRSFLLVLAVKPQQMEEALEQIRPGVRDNALVMSIAAGISTSFIQERLGHDRSSRQVRVIRVMPNTPAMVGAGAAGVSMTANCTDDDAALARTVFEAVGMCEMVPEEAIDTITALSGSGPAYFFYVVECLVNASVAQGLPEDQAIRLASQTLLGAGRLLAESGESPAVLRERVTSKGGTTAAALEQFRQRGLEDIIQAGVAAATARSKELGK